MKLGRSGLIICFLITAVVFAAIGRGSGGGTDDKIIGPKHVVGATSIFVWEYLPSPNCRITTDNPTCPAGDGLPALVNGFCQDEAACNPLSAAELLPKGKKIVETHFYAGEGNLMYLTVQYMPGTSFKECKIETNGCSIGYCRWERVAAGYGKFKNWADHGRTALIIATIADQ